MGSFAEIKRKHYSRRECPIKRKRIKAVLQDRAWTLKGLKWRLGRNYKVVKAKGAIIIVRCDGGETYKIHLGKEMIAQGDIEEIANAIIYTIHAVQQNDKLLLSSEDFEKLNDHRSI